MPTRATQLKQMSPWIPLLGLTTIWHANRGAPGDAVIYGTLTTLLVIDFFSAKQVASNHVVIISRRVLIIFAIPFGAMVAIAPHYWLGTGAVMIVFGFYALYVMWFQGPTIPSIPKTKSQKLTTRLWILVIVPFLLLETYAFILEEASLTDYESPTITVLLDPYLASSLGRGIFAALWLWCGITLLMKRPVPISESL